MNITSKIKGFINENEDGNKDTDVMAKSLEEAFSNVSDLKKKPIKNGLKNDERVQEDSSIFDINDVEIEAKKLNNESLNKSINFDE